MRARRLVGHRLHDPVDAASARGRSRRMYERVDGLLGEPLIVEADVRGRAAASRRAALRSPRAKSTCASARYANAICVGDTPCCCSPSGRRALVDDALELRADLVAERDARRDAAARGEHVCRARSPPRDDPGLPASTRSSARDRFVPVVAGSMRARERDAVERTRRPCRRGLELRDSGLRIAVEQLRCAVDVTGRPDRVREHGSAACLRRLRGRSARARRYAAASCASRPPLPASSSTAAFASASPSPNSYAISARARASAARLSSVGWPRRCWPELSRAAVQPLHVSAFARSVARCRAARDLFLQTHRADLEPGEHAAADHDDADHEPQRDLQLRAATAHAGAHVLCPARRSRQPRRPSAAVCAELRRLFVHQREQRGIELRRDARSVRCAAATERGSGTTAIVARAHTGASDGGGCGGNAMVGMFATAARRLLRQRQMATAARTAAAAAVPRPSSATRRCSSAVQAAAVQRRRGARRFGSAVERRIARRLRARVERRRRLRAIGNGDGASLRGGGTDLPGFGRFCGLPRSPITPDGIATAARTAARLGRARRTVGRTRLAELFPSSSSRSSDDVGVGRATTARGAGSLLSGAPAAFGRAAVDFAPPSDFTLPRAPPIAAGFAEGGAAMTSSKSGSPATSTPSSSGSTSTVPDDRRSTACRSERRSAAAPLSSGAAAALARCRDRALRACSARRRDATSAA